MVIRCGINSGKYELRVLNSSQEKGTDYIKVRKEKNRSWRENTVKRSDNFTCTLMLSRIYPELCFYIHNFDRSC